MNQRTPSLLATVRRIATEEGMFPCAETSPEVLEIAGRGMTDPKSLTEEEIKSVCASAVAQAPKRLRFPCRIEEKAAGEFVATFRDVPEAVTGGSTAEEAATHAADALRTVLAVKSAAPSEIQDGEIWVEA